MRFSEKWEMLSVKTFSSLIQEQRPFCLKVAGELDQYPGRPPVYPPRPRPGPVPSTQCALSPPLSTVTGLRQRQMAPLVSPLRPAQPGAENWPYSQLGLGWGGQRSVLNFQSNVLSTHYRIQQAFISIVIFEILR